MRVSFPTLLAATVLISEVSAAVLHSNRGVSHHARIARRSSRKVKRCIQSPQGSSSAAPQPTDSGNGNNNNNNNNGGNNNNNNNGNTGNSSPSSGSGGTIQADTSNFACGDPNASSSPTSGGGPNGSEDWLDCGITGGGWVPPPVYLSNMVYVSLEDALSQPNSVFAPCQGNLDDFNAVAGQTGIPAILLASISLQESTCNPGATGPNGEVGLMQITPDKCPDGYADDSCYNAQTNINIGGQYFNSVLSDSGGNVAAALGGYNGWTPGMTEADANDKSTCGQRNNLDYLQNVLNGYLQGVDPSTYAQGTFNNLATC